jgi:hypothetical protein
VLQTALIVEDAISRGYNVLVDRYISGEGGLIINDRVEAVLFLPRPLIFLLLRFLQLPVEVQESRGARRVSLLFVEGQLVSEG